MKMDQERLPVSEVEEGAINVTSPCSRADVT
jgi:hypothetical protein